MIPSGPGADPALVFRRASSTCLLDMMSVIGPEYWLAKQMAASCKTISIICSADVMVPPSIVANALTQPSAALVAVGNGVPSLSTIS